MWQFVDLMLEARKIDAAPVLASLPHVGAAGAREYGLVWSAQNMANEMQPDVIVGLTVAGLGHVRTAGPLVSAFVHLLRLFGEAERGIVPAPDREVHAVVTSFHQVFPQFFIYDQVRASGPRLGATLGPLWSCQGAKTWHELGANGPGIMLGPGVRNWHHVSRDAAFRARAETNRDKCGCCCAEAVGGLGAISAETLFPGGGLRCR